jgi:hypothetical protein
VIGRLVADRTIDIETFRIDIETSAVIVPATSTAIEPIESIPMSIESLASDAAIARPKASGAGRPATAG